MSTAVLNRLAASPIFTARLRDGGSVEVFDRIAAVDPALWRHLFPGGWKDDRYYRTLEETFAEEFLQHYLVLRDEDGGARALQPLFFVEQDLTVSLAPGVRVALGPVRRWLRLRLLMVGCIVGEGQIGVAETGEVALVCGALAEALERFARSQRVSTILFKDFPATYRSVLRSLTADGGYTRLPSLPGVSLNLDFASYEEYVQTRLGRATRKSLRRKFREVDNLREPITLEVRTSITREEAVTLHALYERVARRGDVHFEIFTPEYFLKLGERMPDQARYFIWQHSGRMVAFSFCTVHGDTLFDNDLGLDEAVAGSLHLYHVTFRDLVHWALAHGLKRYCSSPFNYHPKLRLGMELAPLDLYARHLSPVVNRLLRWVAPLAAPTRQEPLLREFPNGDQL